MRGFLTVLDGTFLYFETMSQCVSTLFASQVSILDVYFLLKAF
jgi:hypothetical protein